MQPVLEDWGDISTKKASYNRLAALVMSLPAMGNRVEKGLQAVRGKVRHPRRVNLRI
jgi:hypothetical protein